jgi:hypothetical protein
MITMIKTYSTPDEFLTAEMLLWGEDEVFGWIEAGWVIVPDPVKGYSWALDSLDKRPGIC